ncbi:MAG: DUF5680 domain-containing protein [Sphaerochaetaceae bacterium]
MELMQLETFLVEAIQHTYASENNRSTVKPAFPGSRQLEYEAGPFFYRDVYWGASSFAGQELVTYHAHPVWSMVYAGGMIDPMIDENMTKPIIMCLKQALRAVEPNIPYRGPRSLVNGTFSYHNAPEGTIAQFHGKETILNGGVIVYELLYQGGLVH